jgi:hypothetical protein
MSDRSDALKSLTPAEKQKLVQMLARLVIERRKEKERFDALKKI